MAQTYTCAYCRHEAAFPFAACPLCGREAAQATAGEVALVCYKCDFETGAQIANCPVCGHPLVTPTRVRVLGVILMALGAFLVVFMGAITIFVAGVVAHSSDPDATTRFEGGAKELALIYAVFGAVMAFGLGCLVAGLWQAWHGRRNPKLTKAVLAVAFVLALLASLVPALL